MPWQLNKSAVDHGQAVQFLNWCTIKRSIPLTCKQNKCLDCNIFLACSIPFSKSGRILGCDVSTNKAKSPEILKEVILGSESY